MRNVVSIKKQNILVDAFSKTFQNPKYVFFKIEDGLHLKVKDNTYVYKNDIIMVDKNGMSIHSSISGRVLGVKDMLYTSGKYSSLVIENDFKEETRMKKSARKYINNYDKKEFIRTLEDTSLDKIYAKIRTNSKNLIINGVEREPFFGNKYFILKDNAENLLETVDLISELFEFENVIFAIKNIDIDIIQSFMDEIGTYPNIELRLINDEYPCGIDDYLKELVGFKDACVLDVSEINEIYESLKKELPISEKYITISGNAVTPKSVIKVKKGSLLSEVFTNNFDFSEKSVDVYLNGIMSGHLVDTLQYVIDDDLDGILLMKKTDHEECECINCGLCIKNCPRKLNPKYVKDHNGKVKSDYKESCLHCGLCNYVCPQNRDLMSAMVGDKS